MAPWAGKAPGYALLPVPPDNAGPLNSQHPACQQQSVERVRVRGRAGLLEFQPILWKHVGRRGGVRDERWWWEFRGAGWRPVNAEQLRYITLLCSQQSHQCGIWKRVSQHRLRKDLLYLHHAYRRWEMFVCIFLFSYIFGSAFVFFYTYQKYEQIPTKIKQLFFYILMW